MNARPPEVEEWLDRHAEHRAEAIALAELVHAADDAADDATDAATHEGTHESTIGGTGGGGGTGGDTNGDTVRDTDRGTSGIEEAVKWRRLTFTTGGDWHHWLCAVAVTARGVNLMFHKGALLDDPAGLLRGDGRYLRHVPHHRAVEHPDEVTALVRQAIARQTEMLD